jgi:hypothetical protein
MPTVFALYHEYTKQNGDEEEKLIGIYSSRPRALEAILRLKGMPGFKDHHDGFKIYEIELDRDSWSEGFLTVE